MKKIISAFLALVLLLGMLPAGMPTASAMYTWLKDRELVSGSDFTRSAKMAEKLDAIFDGDANIYHDVKCTQPVNVLFGTSAVPNNNVYKYIGPEGGPAICSGTSCWVYANGVYYTLFGESTFSGVAGANSERLSLGYNRVATYEKFREWGVRPAVGALIRAAGHSMIVLGYDAQSLTILDGNGDGKGLISIRIRSWDEVEFSVEYIIQPKEEFYNATYPGWSMPAVKSSHAASCYLEVTEETFVQSQPGGADSLALERAVPDARYEAVRLVENEAGELWYEVRTCEGVSGYLAAADTAWLGDRDDVTALGITAPTHHPMGQKYDLSGSILTGGSALTAVSARIYQQGEEGSIPVSGDEATATGTYYNLSKSPMDQKSTFGKLAEGAYTYEVAATYSRSHAEGADHVVTQTASVVLYCASFWVTTGAVVCNHAYVQTQLQAPTCAAQGYQNSLCSHCGAASTELIPPTEDHSYARHVAEEAACENEGVALFACEACPAGYFEAIPAKGHSFGAWETVAEAGCATEGREERVCAHCAARESQILSATGHNYVSQWVEANCSDYAKDLYTCQKCGDCYAVYPQDDAAWSDTKPEAPEESLLETKTQYRYADHQTLTSHEPEMPGYTLEESHWEETENALCHYAKSWPVGFSEEHALYAAYDHPIPTAVETETVITEVGAEQQVGWLYYHWCANTYTAGPANRGGKAVPSEKYNTFHAFYSTVSPTTLVAYSDGSYIHSNADCCRDTYWYFIVPVYSSSYATRQKVFTYAGWTEWSAWSDEQPEAAEQRKVETRIVYRVKEALGDHTWTEGSITEAPTCLQEGLWTQSCIWCEEEKTQPVSKVDHSYREGACIWCGEKDPRHIQITSPIDETVKQGNRAAFTVVAEGPVKSYQWQYQMVPGGAWWNCTQYTKGYNTPVLNVIAAEKRDGFRYRCQITDASGQNHYSQAATFRVDLPAVDAFAVQPVSRFAAEGYAAVFSVDTQVEVVSYQWQYQTVPGGQWYDSTSATQGYNTPTLTVQGAAKRDGFSYRCVVTDSQGYIHTSREAKLTISTAQFVAHPVSQSLQVGETTVFTAQVAGSYQRVYWQYSVNGGRGWIASTFAGCNTTAMTVEAQKKRDGFLYRCVIIDIEGNMITSQPARLTVE